MTDTTARDLIQRLADELQGWIDYAPIGPVDDEQTLIDEARAYLAHAEPEDKVLARVEFAKRDFNGPSDVILAKYCDDWFYGDPERTEVDPVDLCRGAIELFAQTPAPTPVSERLPGSEDCDAEGRCWWWDDDDDKWCLHEHSPRILCWTHWLPHYALPVPTTTPTETP